MTETERQIIEAARDWHRERCEQAVNGEHRSYALLRLQDRLSAACAADAIARKQG